MSIPVAMSWSGGKDSAMALWALMEDPRYDVVVLLTTLTDRYRRIVMQGIREDVLDLQAQAIGIPLHKVWLSGLPSNDEYETKMAGAMQALRNDGIRHVAHGDLFLEDVRDYRERNLARIGMSGVYPIWKRDTAEMAQWFIHRGFRARLSCVDGSQLDARFVGRDFDQAFLQDIPDAIDPCGENGEFHTCVSAGPIFRRPLDLVAGERVTRIGRFHYCDFLPA